MSYHSTWSNVKMMPTTKQHSSWPRGVTAQRKRPLSTPLLLLLSSLAVLCFVAAGWLPPPGMGWGFVRAHGVQDHRSTVSLVSFLW
jgi:hypothetical protein